MSFNINMKQPQKPKIGMKNEPTLSDRVGFDGNALSQQPKEVTDVQFGNSARDNLLQKEINGIRDEINGKVENIENQVENISISTEQLTDRVNSLDTKVNQLEDKVEHIDIKIDEKINVEKNARIASDTQLQGNIDALGTSLSQSISAEENARIEAISTESTNRINADILLQTNINNEATARQQEDERLQNAIDNIDLTPVYNAISQEATARANADALLTPKTTTVGGVSLGQSTDNLDNYKVSGVLTQFNTAIDWTKFTVFSDNELQYIYGDGSSDEVSIMAGNYSGIYVVEVDNEDGYYLYVSGEIQGESLQPNKWYKGFSDPVEEVPTPFLVVEEEINEDYIDIFNEIVLLSTNITLKQKLDSMDATINRNSTQIDDIDNRLEDYVKKQTTNGYYNSEVNISTNWLGGFEASTEKSLNGDVIGESTVSTFWDNYGDGSVARLYAVNYTSSPNAEAELRVTSSGVQMNGGNRPKYNGQYLASVPEVEIEVSARQNADTALGGRIDTEITDRTTAINNEATARQQADAQLQNAINTKTQEITIINQQITNWFINENQEFSNYAYVSNTTIPDLINAKYVNVSFSLSDLEINNICPIQVVDNTLGVLTIYSNDNSLITIPYIYIFK